MEWNASNWLKFSVTFKTMSNWDPTSQLSTGCKEAHGGTYFWSTLWSSVRYVIWRPIRLSEWGLIVLKRDGFWYGAWHFVCHDWLEVQKRLGTNRRWDKSFGMIELLEHGRIIWRKTKEMYSKSPLDKAEDILKHFEAEWTRNLV